MHNAVCVSLCTFKMVPRSRFFRVGVLKDESAVRALNASQIESAAAAAAAAVGPPSLPPHTLSLSSLPLKVEEFCWMSQR